MPLWQPVGFDELLRLVTNKKLVLEASQALGRM